MYRTRLAPQPNGRSRFFRTFSFLHESCFPNPQTPFRVTLFFLLLLIAYLFPLTGKRRTKTPPKTNKKRGGGKRKATQSEIFHSYVLSLSTDYLYIKGGRVLKLVTEFIENIFHAKQFSPVRLSRGKRDRGIFQIRIRKTRRSASI